MRKKTFKTVKNTKAINYIKKYYDREQNLVLQQIETLMIFCCSFRGHLRTLLDSKRNILDSKQDNVPPTDYRL